MELTGFSSSFVSGGHTISRQLVKHDPVAVGWPCSFTATAQKGLRSSSSAQ